MKERVNRTVDLRKWQILCQPPESGAIDWFDDPLRYGQGLKGLGLRMFASGANSWFVHYYLRGGEKARNKARYTIGSTQVLDYYKARQEAEKVLRDVAAGIDPAQVKKDAAAAKKLRDSGEASFAGLARAFITEYARQVITTTDDDGNEHEKTRLREKTAKEYERQINRDLIPAFKGKDATAITIDDVHKLIKRIADEGHGYASNRTLALISTIYAWAISARKGITTNPATGLKPCFVEQKRKRWLKDDDIKALWAEVCRDSYNSNFSAIWRLGLLLGQRRGEIEAMRWDELGDLDAPDPRWTLQPDRTKTGEQTQAVHIIPLVGLALKLLRERKAVAERDATFVFPARRGGGAASSMERSMELTREATDLKYRFHDLRRTFSTHINGFGSQWWLVVEKLLNHKAPTGAIAATYNHSDYATEKRAALVLWDAKVCGLVGAEHRIEPSNVTKLTRAA